MSNSLMTKLLQLIQLKKFNESLNQRQQPIKELTKSLMKCDLRRDSVFENITDRHNLCRSDVIIIESKKKSKKFKCLQNNCGFKCRLRIQLKKHRLSHKYDKRFKCNECQKEFRFVSDLKVHQLVHSNERQLICDWSECRKSFKRKISINTNDSFI